MVKIPYTSTALVSATFFNGETIPNDNLIPEARFNAISNRVDRFINLRLGITKTASLAADPYGDIEECGIKLWNLALAGIPLFMTTDDALQLKRYHTNAKGLKVTISGTTSRIASFP